jgi:hypothetical protein
MRKYSKTNKLIETFQKSVSFFIDRVCGYSKHRQKSKLKSIKSQIEKPEMPLSSYTFIHRDVKLSENDKELIYSWLNKLKSKF